MSILCVKIKNSWLQNVFLGHGLCKNTILDGTFYKWSSLNKNNQIQFVFNLHVKSFQFCNSNNIENISVHNINTYKHKIWRKFAPPVSLRH